MFVEYFFDECSMLKLILSLFDECSMLKLILSLFNDDFFCSQKFTKLKCSHVGGGFLETYQVHFINSYVELVDLG